MFAIKLGSDQRGLVIKMLTIKLHQFAQKKTKHQPVSFSQFQPSLVAESKRQKKLFSKHNKTSELQVVN